MSNEAFVTLATNDTYGLGALVLGRSLRRVATSKQTVVLITPDVSQKMKEELAHVFNLVVAVDPLDSGDTAHLALMSRPELGITFTKLHAWRLVQFSKCVFLDADTLVVQNCDELFEREELSAAPDPGWPDCFNSGVFVFVPSEATFKALLDFAVTHGSFDGGDQGLLNMFFSDWATGDIRKHLPFIYNVVSSATYSYLPALKHFGSQVKIAHFLGNNKPWMRQSQVGSSSPYQRAWWSIFREDVAGRLTQDMAGVPGVLARGEPDDWRREAWEAGDVDYLGRDSFDNIWKRICECVGITAQTLSAPAAPAATSAGIANQPLAPAPTVVDIVPEEKLPAPLTEKLAEPVVLPEKKIESVEKPSEPILTEKKPAEPEVSAEKPVETVVSAVKPTEPVVSAEKPVEPTVTAEKSVEPVVTAEKPAEPVITAEKPAEPVVSADKPAEPVVSADKPAEPVVSADKPAEPVVSADKPAEPVVSAEKSVESVVTAAKPAEPVAASAEKPAETVPSCEKLAEPAPSKKPAEPAVSAEKSAEPVACAKKAAEPVVTAEKPVEPVVSSEKIPETLAATEKPSEPSVITEKLPEPAPVAVESPTIVDKEKKAESTPTEKPSESSKPVEIPAEKTAEPTPVEEKSIKQEVPLEEKPLKSAEKSAEPVAEAPKQTKISEAETVPREEKAEVAPPLEKSVEAAPSGEKPTEKSVTSTPETAPQICPMKPSGPKSTAPVTPVGVPSQPTPSEPSLKSGEARIQPPLVGGDAPVCKKEPGTPTITPPSGPASPQPADVPPEVCKLQATSSQPATPPASSHQTTDAPVPPKRKQGKNGKSGKGKK
ncbi:unnamed protein product [Nezara viridula]|uniref:glycogenin glucosyltransferase n=1 Tax=Nezara viridula TaxID=85310 RepID=A0A9P0HD30_NEZVI|nr:unnamed protein product [Nezara viridula]